MLQVDFTLKEEINILQDVIVEGEGQGTLVQKTPFKPDVINSTTLQSKSTSTFDVLNTLTGVRVRQQWGLGSSADIMINGTSGKGINTFVDGITLDLLGSGYSLNNISWNIIDRLEVYKGVSPVTFGAASSAG